MGVAMDVLVLLGSVFEDKGVSIVQGRVLKSTDSSSIILVPAGICRGHLEKDYYRATNWLGLEKKGYWLAYYGIEYTVELSNVISKLNVLQERIMHRDQIDSKLHESIINYRKAC